MSSTTGSRLRVAIAAACIVAIAYGLYASLFAPKKQSESPGAGGSGGDAGFPLIGPILVLTEREVLDGSLKASSSSAVTAAPSIFQTVALDAVLSSLDPPSRVSLKMALSETNARLEARANPLTEDLEGGDPEEGMRQWSRGRSSLLRSATELARAKWCAADGLCVTVRGACPAGARCIPVWGPSSDPDTSRARFIAWPFASSLVLRVTPSTRAAAALALRTAGQREPSAIALVVTSRDHDIEREPWGRDLRAAFMRWRSLSTIVKEQLRKESDGASSLSGTEADGSASNEANLVDPDAAAPARSGSDSEAARAHENEKSALELRDDDLLVVPKLASLVAVDAFVAEVEKLVPDGRVVAPPAQAPAQAPARR